MTDKTQSPRGMSATETAPLSFVVEVDQIPHEGLDVAFSAGRDERNALADFMKIPAIARLDVEFHLVRRGNERVNVSGEVQAEVTQICGVSLEPFEASVIEPIDVDFAAEDDVMRELAAAGGSGPHGPDDAEIEEPPDPIVDGKIDLGALAGEFLALGLDPYPRKPGVVFEAKQSDSDDTQSPFHVLKKLQDLE